MLANIALRDGADADVGQVVMDEFHFYADPDRGWAWQVPLLELPRAQFVLMSATLGDVQFFEQDLTRRTGRPTAVVQSAERPVPLTFDYVLTPLHETLKELLETRQAPVYVVHFTQAAALEQAQALMSINVCTREEKDAIAETIGDFRFTAGFGKTLSRLVRHGIGVHHAGHAAQVPPAGRDARPGRPAEGHLRHRHPRRRHQRADPHRAVHRAVASTTAPGPGCCRPASSTRSPGRAGRAGYDTAGTVVVQAPEHVVENEAALAKAGDDPKKRRKVVRKKPPRGLRLLGRADVRPPGRGRAGAADVPVHGQPRHAAERAQPARRRLRGHAAPADRQPRGPGRAAGAHPPGRRDLPGPAGRRGGRAAGRAGRAAAAGPG